MPVTSNAYGNFPRHALLSAFDWDGDTVRCALLNASYTFDKDAHQFFADVQSAEVSGSGYTAGGMIVANRSASYDAASDTVFFESDAIAWPNSTITARYAVFYVDTGSPASSYLIGLVDFGEDLSTINAEFRVTPVDGVFLVAS